MQTKHTAKGESSDITDFRSGAGKANKSTALDIGSPISPERTNRRPKRSVCRATEEQTYNESPVMDASRKRDENRY